jgi:hypothetical protein
MTTSTNFFHRYGIKQLVVLLVAVSLFSCELKREYEGELYPSTPATLVCIASLSNESPTTAYVFSTQNPLDTASAQFVSDADVSLYRNDVFWNTLDFADGKYTDNDSLLGNINEEYELRVEHPLFPSLISLPVRMVSLPIIEDLNWNYNSDSSEIMATVIFSDEMINVNGYGLTADLYAEQGFIRKNVRSQQAGTEIAELDGDLRQGTMILPTKITLFEGFVPVDTLKVDSIKINISSVSEEFFLYNNSIPTGEIGGFFPPKDALYSNLEGGYGVFYNYVISSVSIVR